MKNYLDQESIIYDNYTEIVTDRFYTLRYGINRCSRPLCDSLVRVRYELLEWYKNRDIICDDTPTTYNLVWGFSPDDPFGNETNLFFQFNKNVNKGATTIDLNFTPASAGNYLYWRIPSDEPIFNKWENDITNYGDIPDIIWRSKITIGEYDYYLSRDLYFIDPNNSTIIFKSTGPAPVDPIVNAGPDQDITYPNLSGSVTGTYTQGTFPITNVLWTKESGLPLTFGTPTANTTTFTAFTQGTYVLKYTVYDTNSDAYSDTVTINVLSDSYRVYYGFKADNTPVTETDILAAQSIAINDQQSTYVLPLQTAPGVGYVWFAEKLNQPLKTKWQDTVVITNFGFIGTTDDLFGPSYNTANYRVYDTMYATQFSYPIQIKTV